MEFPVPHDPALRCIRLSIPAHRRHLSLLGAAVEAVAREAGLSADSAYAFNMAVVQAISAVLRYTGPDSTPACFELECLDTPERIQVCIRDQGPPWVSASGVAQPETTQAFELVRAMVDTLDYAQDAQGNSLKLVRFRPRRSLKDED